MHTVFYCIYIKCIRSSVFHEPTVQLHPATPQSEKATQMESSYFTLYRNIYIFSMNRYLCISGFSSKAATARRMMSRTGVVKGRNESVGKLERSFSFCPSSFSLATSFFIISKSSPPLSSTSRIITSPRWIAYRRGNSQKCNSSARISSQPQPTDSTLFS